MNRDGATLRVDAAVHDHVVAVAFWCDVSHPSTSPIGPCAPSGQRTHRRRPEEVVTFRLHSAKRSVASGSGVINGRTPMGRTRIDMYRERCSSEAIPEPTDECRELMWSIQAAGGYSAAGIHVW